MFDFFFTECRIPIILIEWADFKHSRFQISSKYKKTALDKISAD